jgi:hypothetical protein
MPLPPWLAARHGVALFGDVMPDRLDVLKGAQEAAQAGALPWPEGARGSLEALALSGALCSASPSELRMIGRAYVASDRVQRGRAHRKQVREFNAARGLTGQSRARPPWIAWQSPKPRRRGVRPR